MTAPVATCPVCLSPRPLGSPCDCTAPERETVAVDRAALERLREANARLDHAKDLTDTALIRLCAELSVAVDDVLRGVR